MNKLDVPSGYNDFKEMLTKEDIDILSICTPAPTHYHILKEAVNFSIKAVFCEKPFTDNIKDAKKVVELYKKEKIVLQVDHQRRFDPLHKLLQAYIKNKKLGDIQQVNFYYTAGIKNTGSHMFDLLRFFFGEVSWMRCFISKNKSHMADDPNVDGILKFKNGVLATFQACDVKRYLIFELDCFLDNGRFVLKNSGFDVDFYGTNSSKYFSGYNELREVSVPFNTKYKRNFMVYAVSHLIGCIRNKKESVSSGMDGLRALELIDASIISANNNGKRINLH